MQLTSKERIAGPDILRGFAAISVIVVHLIAQSGIDFGPVVSQIGSRFTASVTLFFTISAFSIAYTYNDEFINKADFKAFFIKRFFRLAPLFYFAMLIEGMIIFKAFDHLPSLFELLMSGTFLFNLVPKMQDGIVWAGWSLSIEWVFYLLYPAIFVLSNHKKLVGALWLVSIFVSSNIAVVPGATGVEVYMNILNHMVFFISGIAVYLWLPELRKAKVLLGNNAGKVGGVALIVLFTFLIYYFSFKDYPINLYLFYSLIWIGMISVSIIGMPALINTKFTRFLGKASYSIYLMHSIVLYTLEKIGVFAYINEMGMRPVIKFIIAAFVACGLTVIVSRITYKYIELPGMNFGKWIINRKVKKEQVSEPAA
ncbi:acyltransferase [Phytobacter diazotrophicus]|jgi:peptidoglycan/LPS O-acetylase OafA/YrhL|uniref:acyltransferase family protein n=1 Tax=Phytobacter diazotrophicus TaxID=395631 RepID=UPI002908F448|nr:acyltransferase [Phytobacter diazotrophicus]MDU7197532.1 acyltransferase [Enterobacteriaceae bacterium]MDV2871645.1 acyltransferase [Phytobacter diazotrophicus]